MSMGIGTNDTRPDEGRLRGKQESVACFVWFTSEGNVMPKMLKTRLADGTIVQISHIRVIGHRQRNYCGIPTLEYDCETEIEERISPFRLLYYPERQKWKLIWKD